MCDLRSKIIFSLIILSIWLSPRAVLQAKTNVKLTPEEISELAALTSDKVPEIHEARAMARAVNARIATYGGLSREVVTFVTDRIGALGSVQAYRAFLAKPEPIYLGDLHRMKSDMDLMIIPNEGQAPLSTARSDEIATLKTRIEAKFPPDIFHSKMDMTISQDFFKEFPPASEHFEAVSNLPITEKGVEFLPELNIVRGGRQTNLARWGLEQYSRRALELEINPAGLKPNDTYGNLRQVLRWIRYLSENPDATVTETTRAHIKKLLGEILATHKPELLDMLNGSSGKHSSKTLEALDKLQRYTKNSSYTAELLKEYGIADLMKQASAEEKLLTPMAKTASSRVASEKAKRLGLAANGQPFVVHHYTSYAAAQNMSAGALWRSDGTKSIEGRAMRNASFDVPVLYTSIPTGATHSAASAETRVTFYLNPEAIEGDDYKRNGDVFGLITENAIAKDAEGSPRIQRPTWSSLRRDLVEKLENTATRIHPVEREELVRSLSGILRPTLADEDAKLFFRIMEQEPKYSPLPAYMLAQVGRNHPAAFTDNTPVSSKLRKAVFAHLDSSRAVQEMVGREIPVTDNFIQELFASLRGRPYFGDGHKELLRAHRQRVKPELLTSVISDLSSEATATREIAHGILKALRPTDSGTINAIFDQFLKAPDANYGASSLLRDFESHPEIERRMGEILATSQNRRHIAGALNYFGEVDWRVASHGYSRELVAIHPIQSEQIRKSVMSYLKDSDTYFRDMAFTALAQIPMVTELEPELAQVAARRLGSQHEYRSAEKILDGYQGPDKFVLERKRKFQDLPVDYFRKKYPDDPNYYARAHTPLNIRIADQVKSCTSGFREIFIRLFKSGADSGKLSP